MSTVHSEVPSDLRRGRVRSMIGHELAAGEFILAAFGERRLRERVGVFDTCQFDAVLAASAGPLFRFGNWEAAESAVTTAERLGRAPRDKCLIHRRPA